MLADSAGAMTSPLSASPAEGQRGATASSSQGLRGLPAAPRPAQIAQEHAGPTAGPTAGPALQPGRALSLKETLRQCHHVLPAVQTDSPNFRRPQRTSVKATSMPPVPDLSSRCP